MSVDKNHLEKKRLFHLTNWSCVKISGNNAEKFLQGQFTCDVTKISAELNNFAALCNPQGRVLATFFLAKRGEDFICVLPKDMTDGFIKHLNKYAIFSKVILEDILDNMFVLGCSGNQIHLENYNAKDYSVTILTLPGIVPRYLMLGARENCSAFMDKLQEDMSVENDDTLWKLISILSNFPSIYSETIALVTPHMLNLPQLNAVSFNKGCYVGQEIIARTQYLGKSKRHLYAAEVTGDIAITPGTTVHANEVEVGVIIESVKIASEQHLVLAVIQESAVDSSLTLLSSTANIRLWPHERK